MKTILYLIAGFIWNIIKAVLVFIVLSLIWPDIETETVLSLIALYSVIMMLYKAFKK